MIWVLDLDGVVLLEDQPVAGAPEAVARLHEAGERVVFCTNSSWAELRQQEARLARAGIPEGGDVVTSAMAAAMLIQPGERVLACGGPGIAEAARARGAEVVTAAAAAGRTHGERTGPEAGADVVVAGFDRDFDYGRLKVAVREILHGARFVATNEDATHPTPEGRVPAGGAIVAAISYASGVTPMVAGKPHAPMARLVRAVAGEDRGVVVGDRADTDGAFAKALGYQFVLALSGVTSPDDLPVEPTPDHVTHDLAAAVGLLLGPD